LIGDEFMTYAVQCKKLRKDFKNVHALTDVTFNIEENKIYGFLGRNGAGKTTTLNIISTLIFKTSGDLKVFGEDPYENEKVLSKICYFNDNISYMATFKVKEIFKTASYFFENWDENFKDQLVDKFQLDVNKKFIALSKGMGAIVGIIVGLASRAPLTIFDEAYLGLDAVARQQFYDLLLKDYMENPRTIIFSTHLIDEVSSIFENIIILKEGTVFLEDSMENVMSKSFTITGNKGRIEELLRDKKILNRENFGSSEKVYIFDELKEEELKKLSYDGLVINSMTLQELFIQLSINK